MLRLAAHKFLGRAAAASSSSSSSRPVATRFYHENVIDHFNNPRNVGSFDKNDPAVGTGLVGAPACGDVMKLQIRVDEKTGEIVDARFKTFGCGSAIASSSVGKVFDERGTSGVSINSFNCQIAKHLSLPPVKLHCSMLAEDAIKAAVKDYQAKRAKSNGTEAADAPLQEAAKA
ncbi:unnamed protein product [Linum tenue]|uniref:NIF system FeS cluster assembly NifU N-terminal domain-containing protein n=1 Tax=Linum tenue TaxID=586396 RepID=A0AAV0IM13_9ROSI|nr:unnamed protein product [Linum tenue]